MKITYDPNKHERNIKERGIGFNYAAEIFAGKVFEIEDTRYEYGEKRILCIGALRGRVVVVVYTPRGETRHIISMRKANEREQRRYYDQLDSI